tara:strand:- start:228 stop:611 length:384 start_codon:yes stop_codon:yes gene_type:complete
MNLSTSYHVLFSLCWVFISTFLVFAGVFFDSYWSFLSDKSKTSNDQAWYNLSVILTFNVCDTIGRKLGGIIMLSTRKVIAGSILRSIFVVITIIICVGYDTDNFYEADWFKITNLVLFSITNGYIST